MLYTAVAALALTFSSANALVISGPAVHRPVMPAVAVTMNAATAESAAKAAWLAKVKHWPQDSPSPTHDMSHGQHQRIGWPVFSSSIAHTTNRTPRAALLTLPTRPCVSSQVDQQFTGKVVATGHAAPARAAPVTAARVAPVRTKAAGATGAWRQSDDHTEPNNRLDGSMWGRVPMATTNTVANISPATGAGAGASTPLRLSDDHTEPNKRLDANPWGRVPMAKAPKQDY